MPVYFFISDQLRVPCLITFGIIEKEQMFVKWFFAPLSPLLVLTNRKALQRLRLRKLFFYVLLFRNQKFDPICKVDLSKPLESLRLVGESGR